VDALFPRGNTHMLFGGGGPIIRTMPPAPVNYLKSALALSYPFVAHVAVLRSSMPLIAVALGLLIAVAILPALSRGSAAAWIATPIIAAGLWLISRSTHAALPLYIAPVLVPGFMAAVFGSSLLPGQTPVIEQMIHLMQPPEGAPEADVWAYARRLTVAWTVLFVTISITNLVLALLAEPNGLLLAVGVRPPIAVPWEWWSLFANVIGYLLVAAFFLIEYAYRRHRFPRQPYRNLLDFFLKVLAVMPSLAASGQQRSSSRR